MVIKRLHNSLVQDFDLKEFINFVIILLVHKINKKYTFELIEEIH